MQVFRKQSPVEEVAYREAGNENITWENIFQHENLKASTILLLSSLNRFYLNKALLVFNYLSIIAFFLTKSIMIVLKCWWRFMQEWT